MACNPYVPIFIASADPCVLQTFNETRSRGEVVGVFFRSTDVGSHVNSIQVSCVWQYEVVLGSGTWGNTTDQTLCKRVEVIITNGTTEVYHVTQSGSVQNIGTVEVPIYEFEWTGNAIPSLETQINSTSQLVTLNVTDVQHPWPPTPPPVIPIDHLESFASLSLSGGQGGPNNVDIASPTIRTGPALAMVHILDSERNIANGTMVAQNQTSYWDGTIWQPYDLFNPPVPC